MRSGFVILTASVILASGLGFLWAQDSAFEEGPAQLIPKDVDSKFFLKETAEDELQFGQFEASKFRPQPSKRATSEFDSAEFAEENPFLRQVTAKQKTKSATSNGKTVRETSSNPFERAAAREKAIAAAKLKAKRAKSGKVILSDFEMSAGAPRSPIQQVDAVEKNPFDTSFAEESFDDQTVEFGEQEEPAAAPQFPEFPVLNLDADEVDEEADEEDNEELFEQLEQKMAPRAEKKSFEAQLPAIQNDAPNKNATPQTGSFTPASWANRAVKGPVTPSVATRWVTEGVLNVGQRAECQLQVRNVASSAVHNLLVEAVLPEHVELLEVKPEVAFTNGKLVWKLDHLKGSEETSFKVSFIPRKRGPMQAQAHVRFSGMTSAAFHVEEPMLKIALVGPEKVMVGDPATQMISVANPGTGVAEDIVVRAIIPSGLEHPEGRSVSLPVGTINPGEKRSLRLPLGCVSGGAHHVSVVAVAAGGLKEEAKKTIQVVAPELALQASGPRLRFVGRTASFKLNVKNEGSAEASNVRLLHKVPQGFEFVQADKGGKYNKSSRVVQWFVGRLEAGQSRVVQVQLEAAELGILEQKFAVVSDQTERVETNVKTEVDGTASLALEILDLDDPVEIGRETAYEIRVRNIGSKSAQQVSIECDLPKGVQFKSARGPSAHKHNGTKVLFKPLAQLPAGETAIFRVHIIGKLAGKQKFSVDLRSDEDDSPLTFQEQTRFYQD